MPGEHRDTLTVTVNGSDNEIGYQPDAAVQVLPANARGAFGVESQP
jgi:hypothetical protein